MGATKNKRVLFVCEQGDSACAYYRAFIPARGLQQIGWQAGISNMLIQLDNGLLTGLDLHGNLFEAPHVVVVRRLNDYQPGRGDSGTFQSCGGMFKLARKMGQQVYVDLDDDPWTLPEWNPAYGNMTQYELELWQEDMAAATGVLVSTDAIAQGVRDHATEDVFVCRNGIDRTQYQRRPEHDGPLRLGWLGTTDYRGRDLATIRDSLREALQGRLGEVEFWHVGYRRDLQSVRDLLGRDFPVHIVEVEWVPVMALPAALTLLDCAVVPFEQHPFNDARSNVTGLALCAAGVPYAYSSQPEYERLWRMGAGYPAVDGWAHAVRVLTDKQYANNRNDMAAAGLTVAELHNPGRTAAQYVQAFNAGQ